MAKIKLDREKRLRPKKPLLDNKTIVIIKIATACILLLGCSLFFFSDMGLFWDDLMRLSPFPVVFFAGLVWICLYIVNLAGHIDDQDLYHADRHDLIYKIVFIVTVMSMVFRCFVFASLAVPREITIICIVSGIITMFTPKIVDNNNEEF